MAEHESGSRELLEAALYEIRRVIAGQDEMLERVLVCLLAGGHLLIEGVPGLAKTLTIKTTASVLGGSFQRIQFTPDLVPSDLVGTRVYRPGTQTFDTELGPVFCNFLLADEINRAPAKVQSALLEVMQERQVTIGKTTHPVPDPFLVMATQNPIEQEGTYPLPEAQLDRFLMKIYVGYPDEESERKIYRMPSTSTGGSSNGREPQQVLGGEEMLALQKIVHKVPVSEFIVSYVSALIRSTRAAEAKCPQFVKDWVLWGVGPRGGQALISVAKARAALDGRPEVDVQDIKALAKPVLRHRIVLNYNAEAQGQSPETVIDKLIDSIPLHAEAPASHGRIESVLKA